MPVIGTDASELINGSDGVTNNSDFIAGFGGNDTIFALGGADTIYGGEGADTIDGGEGIDTSSYTDSTTGVLVSLASGKGYGGTAEGDTLVQVENLTGSGHNDILVGDDGVNVLSGMGGNDTLKGGGGADTLLGGSGNDTLIGGLGADKLVGGSGIDTVSYKDDAGGVFVVLHANVGIFGEADGDTFSGIENVTGSNFKDILTGDANANVLNGLAGKDILDGAGGADTLIGGSGADILYGNTGADLLSGGADADVFYFEDLSETGTTAAAMDIIADFNATQGDKIQLQQIDANTELAGMQDFVFIGDAAYSGAGQIQVTISNGNTYIGFNANSNPDHEAVIRLNGVHDVDASWFIM